MSRERRCEQGERCHFFFFFYKTPLPPSLSPHRSEIEKMVRQAEEFATADKAKKAFIESKNDADSLLHSTERSLAEHKAKLGAEDITAIETAMAEARAALEKDNVEDLKAKVQALQTASMRIGTAMYKNAGSSASSGSSTGATSEETAKPDEKDAEFKDSNKK